MSIRSWLLGISALLAATALAAGGLAALAWQTVAAQGDGLKHTLRFSVAGHAFEQDASMAVLLRAATHPLAARAIDGRSIDAAQGRWHVRAHGDAGVSARCEPCRLRLPALGPQPLGVERAVLVLRAEGADRYSGTLTLGRERTITLQGRGRFDRDGHLWIDAQLPATPLADVVHALGADLPERDTVQVQGTLALKLAGSTQHGKAWRIEPQLDGFAVAGLGTERLADVQRPMACRTDAQSGVTTIEGWLPRAVVAAEDARFHEHPGFDLQALADALQRNQRAGATLAGASTLSQQLAKLLVTGDERSASRKLRELLYAVEMERTLGKARILQMYLALAPWGEGVCGAERAVRVHLGQRDASKVGPVAAAWLASLLTAPDAHLRAEFAAGEVDHARVARVLDAMRLRGERREKAQVQLLFWAPPALARLREAAPSVEAPSPAPAEATLTAETSPPVAPSP